MTTNLEKKVLDYFLGNFNCAQSVLRTIIEEEGLYFEGATAIASAFGGGICGRGEVCGAVSGAIMAFGVLATKINPDIVEQKKIAREYAEEFYKRFEGHFNNSTCFGLTGVDPKDPKSKQKRIDEGVFRENCPKFVSHAVKFALEIFSERK